MEPKGPLKTTRHFLFLFLMLINEISGSDWNYKGNLGPDSWHQLFTECSGTKQSPINIITKDTVYDPMLKEFAIWFNPPHPGDHMVVINNGHTVKVKTVGKFYVANGGLPNVYKTAQMHFHWGLEDDQGSEHKIDSTAYPLELHIVNYDHFKYSSLSEAMTKPLGLAVLGVMFKVAEEDNPALEPIIEVFEEIQKPGHPKMKISALSMRVFLPEDMSKFYRYNGSLTTPGCYETVIWTIFKQANYISHRQMKKLREIYYNKEFGGHPHHQHHHHDHDSLMQETPPTLTFADNQKIDDGHRVVENKNPTEIPNLHIEVSVKNKEDLTKPVPQQSLEQIHGTTHSAIPLEISKDTVISKDESIDDSIKEDAVTPIEGDVGAGAVKPVQIDEIPQVTSKVTSPKPQENPIVKDQIPQIVTKKGEEAAIPEMQRDASYLQFEIRDHDLFGHKEQHGKHKKHHKHRHHHHINKRHAGGHGTEEEKDVLDGTKEETNYLAEGDEKLDMIEEEIRKSDEIYERIKEEIKAHRIEKIDIINNYRPIQPLNDRIVLRSFRWNEEKPTSFTGYGVPIQEPEYTSKAETAKSSAFKLCLIMLITVIAIFLSWM